MLQFLFIVCVVMPFVIMHIIVPLCRWLGEVYVDIRDAVRWLVMMGKELALIAYLMPDYLRRKMKARKNKPPARRTETRGLY